MEKQKKEQKLIEPEVQDLIQFNPSMASTVRTMYSVTFSRVSFTMRESVHNTDKKNKEAV